MLQKGILFFLIINWSITFATPLKPYVFNNDYHHLSHYYQYLEDCEGFTDKEVIEKFKNGYFKYSTKEKAFNQGITFCSYWLVVKVQNATHSNHNFLWSFYNNGLSFDFYELKNNRLVFIKTASMHQIREQRPYPLRTISFPFSLQSKEMGVYFVKVSPTNNANVYFPTDVAETEDLLMYEINFSYLLGKYFGVLYFVFFVNLSMYLIVKERLFAYNLGYVFFVILFELSDFHFDSYEIPSSIFETWSYVNKGSMMVLALYFYNNVFILFTDSSTHFPKIALILKKINIVYIACALVSFVTGFVDISENSLLLQINLVINSVVYIGFFILFVALLYGVFHKKKYFILFGISSLFLFYGFISYILYTLHYSFLPIIKPGNIINGMVLETSLMTIFFVYKYKIEREIDVKKILTLETKNGKLAKTMLQIEAQEQERLAQNIHDEIGSDITGLRLQIENHLSGSNISDKNQQLILENVKSLYEKVRDFSHFLKSDEFKSNCIETIENQINFYRKNIKNIDFELIICVQKNIEVSPDIQSQLLRIVKEAYTNSLKHSMASKIAMQIIYENPILLLIIEDNGIGFDTNITNKSFGLENMKERVAYLNGKITIDSNKKGTSILIEIPIKC